MEYLHLAIDLLGLVILPIVGYVLYGFRSDVSDLRAELKEAKADISHNGERLTRVEERCRIFTPSTP